MSFGLGRHLFQGHRQEILLALRPRWDAIALDIIVSVGMYMVDRHMPLHVGEPVRIPPELGTTTESLIVSSADDLAAGLGSCFEYTPPVEILWLSPAGGNSRFDL